MATIQEIQDHNANRGNLICKAFGQDGDSLEKSGKRSPEGTIATRANGYKFIKKNGKWEYYSENKGSVKIVGESNKEKIPLEVERQAIMQDTTIPYEERSKKIKEISDKIKSGSQLKEKVDLAQGGAVGIKALMERERQTSKKEPEKNEEILKLLKEYKGKEAWSVIQKYGLFKGKWEQIPSDYNPNRKVWGVKLSDGSKLILELPAYTSYKQAGKGSRLRDPSGTKYESRIKLIHKSGDRYLANEQLVSFGYRGESDSKRQEYNEKQEKYIKILNEATGLNLNRYSFSYT